MLTTNCTTLSTNILIKKIIHASIVFLSFSLSARYGVATGECDIENRGCTGWATAPQARPRISLITTGRAGPNGARAGPKIVDPCRPLIENKGKSFTKEEIEIFCFYLFNVITFQNTQQQV